MSAKDGGPAFPCVESHENPNHPGFRDVYASAGISARDYFAAAALQALVTSHEYGEALRRIFDVDSAIANAGDQRETAQKYTARIAYSLADAMLDARAKLP